MKKFIEFFAPKQADKWLCFCVAVVFIPIIYSGIPIFNTTITNFVVGMVAFGMLAFDYIIKLIKNKSISIKKDIISSFVWMFLFLVVLSACFSVDKKVSWLGSWSNANYLGAMDYFIFVLFFVAAKNVKKENRSWLVSLLVFVVVFLCALGFAFEIANFGIVGFDKKGTLPYSLVFFHPNHAGYVVSMTTMAAAMMFVFEKNKIKKTLVAIEYVVLLSHLVCNGSMGPILATITVGILAFVLYCFSNPKCLKWFGVAVALFVAVFCIFDFVPKVKDVRREKVPTYAQIASAVDYMFRGNKSTYTYNHQPVAGADGWDRVKMWKACFENMKERPLMGSGIGTYKVFNPSSPANNPHNEVLQYGATCGIPAMLVYVSIFVALAVVAAKRRKQLSGTGWAAAIGTITYFASSLLGTTLICCLPYLFLLLGVATSEVLDN